MLSRLILNNFFFSCLHIHYNLFVETHCDNKEKVIELTLCDVPPLSFSICILFIGIILMLPPLFTLILFFFDDKLVAKVCLTILYGYHYVVEVYLLLFYYIIIFLLFDLVRG